MNITVIYNTRFNPPAGSVTAAPMNGTGDLSVPSAVFEQAIADPTVVFVALEDDAVAQAVVSAVNANVINERAHRQMLADAAAQAEAAIAAEVAAAAALVNNGQPVQGA